MITLYYNDKRVGTFQGKIVIIFILSSFKVEFYKALYSVVDTFFFSRSVFILLSTISSKLFGIESAILKFFLFLDITLVRIFFLFLRKKYLCGRRSKLLSKIKQDFVINYYKKKYFETSLTSFSQKETFSLNELCKKFNNG